MSKVLDQINKFLRRQGFAMSSPDRSWKDGDTLTLWETQYIRFISKCPDCGDGDLWEGPSGGLSTNYLCGKCGSKYNLGLFNQRISNSSLADELWDSWKTIHAAQDYPLF